MTMTSKVTAALKKADFVEERLTPLFPDLARYELTEVNGLPVLNVYLPNPQGENLPAKITIAGQKVRFAYHPSTK